MKRVTGLFQEHLHNFCTILVSNAQLFLEYFSINLTKVPKLKQVHYKRKTNKKENQLSLAIYIYTDHTIIQKNANKPNQWVQFLPTIVVSSEPRTASSVQESEICKRHISAQLRLSLGYKKRKQLPRAGIPQDLTLLRVGGWGVPVWSPDGLVTNQSWDGKLRWL